MTDQGISHAMRLVAVSVMGSAADLNNSGGTWVTGKRSGLSRIYAALSPGVQRIAYLAPDWIPISSVDRTDGGTYPLIAMRMYAASSAALPVYGDGVDDFTAWAAPTGRRLWAARQQTGENISTPSTFTSTTNLSQSPIVGVQYLSRGKVITVAAVGDSITEGRGSYLGEGFVLPAIESLSSSTTTFEYMNLGWSGQSMLTFAERAIDIMQGEFRPDILVMPAASPNDTVSTITAANITAFRGQRSRVAAEARRQGVALVLWTWLPTNTSVRPYGATDSLRTDYNAEVLAQDAKNFIVVDASTTVSGVVTGGQVQMLAGSTTDNIHPNDTGNGLLTPLIRDGIVRAAQIGSSGGAPTSFPSYAITDTDAYVTGPGAWIYAGTSVASWTLTPIQPVPRRVDAPIFIHVRETAAPLTLNRSGANFFSVGSLSPASIVIRPGQSVMLTPGSANLWDVHGLSLSTVRSVIVDANATMTLTRDASVYVNSGGAPTWTLPAIANNTGLLYKIKNRGTGSITLTRAGSDQIYDTAAVSTLTITAGSSVDIVNDGTYWLVA